MLKTFIEAFKFCIFIAVNKNVYIIFYRCICFETKYIPDSQWTNVGVTWDVSDNSSSSVQAWIDGIKPARDLRNVAAINARDVIWKPSATNLMIGRHNYENRGHLNLDIHNLAIWESVTNNRRASRLLGLSGECKVYEHYVV